MGSSPPIPRWAAYAQFVTMCIYWNVITENGEVLATVLAGSSFTAERKVREQWPSLASVNLIVAPVNWGDVLALAAQYGPREALELAGHDPKHIETVSIGQGRRGEVDRCRRCGARLEFIVGHYPISFSITLDAA